jgi:hypothetical protein
MASNVPSLADLQKFSVNRNGAPEVVRQTLYDFQLYPTAGNPQLSFFQNPVGQGVTSANGATAGAAKSKADTNMTLSGQLPNPQAFLVESIEVIFQPGSVSTANTFTPYNPAQFNSVETAILLDAANDVVSVLSCGFLDFFIGSKSYLTEAPLFSFPCKTGISVESAFATNSATTGAMFSVNARSVGRPYYIDPMISLMATQNFNITLNWPASIATPSGFNGRIGIKLDGMVYRNSQ